MLLYVTVEVIAPEPEFKGPNLKMLCLPSTSSKHHKTQDSKD